MSTSSSADVGIEGGSTSSGGSTTLTLAILLNAALPATCSGESKSRTFWEGLGEEQLSWLDWTDGNSGDAPELAC